MKECWELACWVCFLRQSRSNCLGIALALQCQSINFPQTCLHSVWWSQFLNWHKLFSVCVKLTKKKSLSSTSPRCLYCLRSVISGKGQDYITEIPHFLGEQGTPLTFSRKNTASSTVQIKSMADRLQMDEAYR